jgi:F-type H+-transporting ATPase subunit delta
LTVAARTGNQNTAKRYATAFFELAKEQSQIDAIAGDLESLTQLLALEGDVLSFMYNPTLRRQEQATALEAIAQHLKLSKLTTQFLGTLALKRRLDVLPQIITAMRDLISVHKGEITAEVISAQALDQKQITELAANLKSVLGVDVRVSLHVDPEIMGGLIIRVGSRLIDSSVRTKLERLHRALKNNNSSSDQKKMKEVA